MVTEVLNLITQGTSRMAMNNRVALKYVKYIDPVRTPASIIRYDTYPMDLYYDEMKTCHDDIHFVTLCCHDLISYLHVVCFQWFSSDINHMLDECGNVIGVFFVCVFFLSVSRQHITFVIGETHTY